MSAAKEHREEIDLHVIDIPSITEFRWITSKVTPEDLLIVVSYSGENEEVNALVQGIKLRKVPILSITPMRKNTLSRISSEKLYYTVTELQKTELTMNNDYNLFTTLHILLDALYRKYLDAN